MFAMKNVLFLCSLWVFGANAGQVDFIKPCHWQDSGCILESAKAAVPHFLAGIKSIGIEPLNHIVVKSVNCDSGDLKLTLENIDLKGLEKCDIKNFTRPDMLKFYVELESPISVTGKYKADGLLITLPVYGNDEFEISTDKIRFIITINLEKITKDGKEYFKITNFDYKYDLVKKVKIVFHNLFDGDTAKAELVNKVMDENWKDMIDTFGAPVIREIVVGFVKPIGKFLLSVPTNELELK